MSGYSTRTSLLSNPSGARAGGRKIDTWTFQRPTTSPTREKTEIEVFMVSQADGQVGFRLASQKLPGEDWTDTDLMRLRERAETTLREQDELLGGITWEPWLEVQTSLKHDELATRHHHVEKGRQLNVRYRPLMRGVDPKQPERILTINSNGWAVDFPTPLTPKSPREEREVFMGGNDSPLNLGRDDGRVPGDTYAYLPDTPENRAALDHIFHSMEVLGERLHALLSPENVASAMAQLHQHPSKLPLLTHPDAQDKPDTSSPRGRSARPR